MRKYATAETSTETLSLVMMPCDWIGIVTIRSDTRCTRSTNGAIKIRPGPRALVLHLSQPKLDSSLVLLENPDAAKQAKDADQHRDRDDDIERSHETLIPVGQVRVADIPEPVRTGASHARLGWTGTPSVAPSPWRGV